LKKPGGMGFFFRGGLAVGGKTQRLRGQGGKVERGRSGGQLGGGGNMEKKGFTRAR